MIHISEVLEEAAREADYKSKVLDYADLWAVGYAEACENIAESIRALAAKYEGCIVAEGSPVRTPIGPLYRAKEAK
jgi:hypothetical protein